MNKKLLKNARMVNEGVVSEGDLLISGQRIEKIASSISDASAEVFDLNGQYLMPGMIDDQVHFREPGLTAKGEIATESAAAIAGGITSFMEMPNTAPPTTNLEALEAKYDLGAQKALANYSFYLGASNNNVEEVKKADPTKICGLKIFMGASTGNLLVDDPRALEDHFTHCPMQIATHCEDTPTIIKNQEKFEAMYGDDIPMRYHGQIRSEEACYLSSSMAVDYAKRTGARLHVLHLTTEKEMELFSDAPLAEKRITGEVCVHHLFFSEEDYDTKGTLIKWNPAVKRESDRAALRKALLEGKLDAIATDHAPHTWEEKQNPYTKAPSGGPLVQHALPSLFDGVNEGWLPLEKVIEKACHNPATIYGVAERGFLREGYFADLAVFDLQHKWTVEKQNLLYKCGWSPFDGHTFSSKITKTFVNGDYRWDGQNIIGDQKGMRLRFNR
jgi:dihydroorotase